MSAVSVVVPIYNAGSKLHKCIKSILNQSFIDFELILVNDGSTDNSLDICRRYAKMDNRIMIIDKQNEGSVKTRKRGVDSSKSDYVMFVDADDWIDTDAVKILYAESLANDADIVVCSMYRAYGDFIKKKTISRYFENDRLYNEEEVRNEVLIAYFYGHPFPSSLCAKLYKRSLLLDTCNYAQMIKYFGDDLFYNMEIMLNVKRIKMVSKPLYYYRVGGFSNKYMPHLFDDMIAGYNIQKDVIENYYQESRSKQYYGISLMLLNTFKTCLYNLFNSNMTDNERKEKIRLYVQNQSLIESTYNEGSIRIFSYDYLNSIRSGDVEYLFNVGKQYYKECLPKVMVKKAIAKLSII